MSVKAEDLVVSRIGAVYRGMIFPCSVGKNGIGQKTGEGDNITPVGIWSIKQVYFRADRLAQPMSIVPTMPIGPSDIWSDDPRDVHYNHKLRKRNHPFGHEHLSRSDPLYDVVAVLDFNWPVAIPGAGSAIFLHHWRKPRHPTAGCVAFSPEILRYILETWTPRSRVVIRA